MKASTHVIPTLVWHPVGYCCKRCWVDTMRQGHQGRTRSFGASGSGAFAAGATPPSVDGCCAAGDGASEGSGTSNSAGAGVASSDSQGSEVGQPVGVSHCMIKITLFRTTCTTDMLGSASVRGPCIRS